jgi:uncharacterized protein YrrD
MKLKKGADVFNAKGDKLGTLHRVILDPDTKAVTHIAVEKGWLFSTDKVISINELDPHNDDRLVVTGPHDDPDDFPAFEESHYVNLDENDHPDTDVESVYWYPPANLAWWRTGATYMGYYPPIPNYAVRTTRNIPEGTVALDEGAKVVSKDDKHVGNIEQVIVEPEDNRATHFVVHGGLFSSERKLIPVLWISHIDEKEVHLSVGSGLLERLPEYKVEAR